MEIYASQLLFALIILICLALILPMRAYALRLGEKASFWISPLVLSWGFLWVILSRVNWRWFTKGYTFWWKWGAFILLGSAIYLVVWWLLRKKGKKHIENKIEEIGS